MIQSRMKNILTFFISSLLVCFFVTEQGCTKKEIVPTILKIQPGAGENSPPLPFRVSVLEVGSNYAVINWGPVYDPDWDTVYQEIVLNDSVITSGLTEDKVYKITNLKPVQSYQGYVSVTDKKSNPIKIPFTFTTKRYIILFNRLYPGFGASDLNKTIDGGYILAGGKSFFKIDSLGYVQWLIPATDFDNDQGKVFQTRDGGYIHSNNGSIQKFDANGNKLWASLSPSFQLVYNSVTETIDGKYLVAGIFFNLTNIGTILKFDQNGVLEWQKYYDPNSSPTLSNCYSISNTKDGNFIIVGLSGVNGPKLGASKIDSSGNILWTQVYNHGTEIINAKIEASSDNSFIISANTAASNDVFSAWVVNIDQDGNRIWDQSFLWGDDTYCNSIVPLKEGGYVFVGAQYYSPEQAIIIKLDQNGNQLWKKEFFQKNSLDYIWQFHSVKETKDKGLIIMGLKNYVYSGTERGMW